MNKKQPMTHSSMTQQAGATLIVVLIMVLFLAIIGAIAVRNSQVGLDMTTSAQVNQLLTQSSDVPLAKLELAGIEPGADKMTQLQNMDRDNNSPIGLLKTEGRKDYEYVLCYQPTIRDSLYKRGAHRILVDAGGGLTGNEQGYCKVADGSAEYFTSARKTVASQISITRPTVNNSIEDDVQIKPFEAANIGMDNIGKSDASYFRAHVTSVLPALSISSKDADIQKCLELPIGGLAGATAANNQIQCLDKTDTPINIQVQDFAYNLKTE
jgi:hypothetical protein